MEGSSTRLDGRRTFATHRLSPPPHDISLTAAASGTSLRLQVMKLPVSTATGRHVSDPLPTNRGDALRHATTIVRASARF